MLFVVALLAHAHPQFTNASVEIAVDFHAACADVIEEECGLYLRQLRITRHKSVDVSPRIHNSSAGNILFNHDTLVVERHPKVAMPKKPAPGQLWGGPSKFWAAQRFNHKMFSTWSVPQVMNYARFGSRIPESLWGIFWMDQYGASSIARDKNYPFQMVGTPEVLASFGEADWEEETSCVTPVPCYGGAHWASLGNTAGSVLMDDHLKQRNTLSFCFEDPDDIQIHQKILTKEASIGPVSVGGSWAAWALGFTAAGDGYSWMPRHLMDLKMKRTSWGWDRVTYVLKHQKKHSWPVQAVLNKVENMLPVSHYPAIQIVDGLGQPTQYYGEFLQFMSTQTQGHDMLINLPA